MATKPDDAEIFALIDAMPMRQREMRQSNDFDALIKMFTSENREI